MDLKMELSLFYYKLIGKPWLFCKGCVDEYHCEWWCNGHCYEPKDKYVNIHRKIGH